MFIQGSVIGFVNRLPVLD